ncbi:MAG TPA: HEAT repeat domain-containing protein [Phycisphaerae bacterium]|nr:HEAT repeat domain-containing protein [Phycisphaerae bacterium]HRY69735.1 HEAT repeat domain-containing protein [Phycisphaerae bacterium]HSA29375.1 HEAT repeat domain-containing protein [Phycisphaerae bacterium]
MNRTLTLILIATLGWLPCPAAAAESVSVLLEKAVYAEETKGDVEEAIRLYKQIVEADKADRPYAAQAMFRLAECYLKQNKPAEATAAFQTLVRRFPGQKEWVEKAEKRLASSQRNLTEAQMAPLIKKAITIISTLTESDPKVGETLATLQGLDSKLAAKILASHLKSPEANARRAAIYILWMGQFDNIDPAVEGLSGLCSHEEDLTRGMAALALGSKKITASYDKVAEMALKDKSGYARRCAAIALGWMGRPEAKEVLEKVNKDEDAMVRANAEAALKLLEQTATKPPVILSTTPKALANDVPPDTTEITATFNQRMLDQSWSWTGGGETYPKLTGRPSYDASRTQCTLPVQLQPGKVYWVGINSPSHRNFKSEAKIPAARHVILFATRSADGKPTPIPEDLVSQAKAINEPAKPTSGRPSPDKAMALLDPETRSAIEHFEQSFANWFRPETRYEAASQAEKDAMVEQWMAEARGNDFRTRTRAIAALGNISCKKATNVLISIVDEPMGNQRPKWMAIRGLGRIGDKAAVPVLIELVEYGNQNVQVYARLALAQITGEYFGTSKEKWRAWWKNHR